LLGNRLNGEIPDYLAELPLVKLELSQNNFTGMLPCGSHQPFWRSVGVHRFELSLPKVVYRNGFFTKHYQKPSAGIPGRNVAASSHTQNRAEGGGRMSERTERVDIRIRTIPSSFSYLAKRAQKHTRVNSTHVFISHMLSSAKKKKKKKKKKQ
jgi:hypothetical protein